MKNQSKIRYRTFQLSRALLGVPLALAQPQHVLRAEADPALVPDAVEGQVGAEGVRPVLLDLGHALRVRSPHLRSATDVYKMLLNVTGS